MKKKSFWKWGRLSKKQGRVLSWWVDGKYKDHDGIIADGAIRSGKTIIMGFSFVLWAMETFDRQQFAMCGKTIQALRRNVINTLKSQLRAEGYTCTERKSENLMVVAKGNRANTFYFFGGKDEASQDLIQGITLAGALFDEVALMPESFVNQSTARCSVDGSKWWFNCNPAGPMHWFYQKWILRCRKKKIVYLHFTMKDNLTLTARIRKRYEAMYSGVFYQRYILGLWVAAEGLIFDMFNKAKHILTRYPELDGEFYVSTDYGIQNATVFLLWRKEKDSRRWICLKEWRYSGREKKKQKTVKQLADGMEAMLDGIMPEKVIVDPSASALIVELRQRGYTVMKGNNDVQEGIEDVSTMLNDGNLVFMKDCKMTIEEFGLYCWDEKAADRGEDKPIKVNDHSMDAVRYFVKTMKLVNRDKNDYIPIMG